MKKAGCTFVPAAFSGAGDSGFSLSVKRCLSTSSSPDMLILGLSGDSILNEEMDGKEEYTILVVGLEKELWARIMHYRPDKVSSRNCWKEPDGIMR